MITDYDNIVQQSHTLLSQGILKCISLASDGHLGICTESPALQ